MLVSAINQSQKDEYYMVTLYEASKTVKLMEAGVEWWLPAARRRAWGDAIQWVESFSYTRWISCTDLLHNRVPVVNNTVLCT